MNSRASTIGSGCGAPVDQLFTVVDLGAPACVGCWKSMTLELRGEITLGDWWHAITGEDVIFLPKNWTEFHP